MRSLFFTIIFFLLTFSVANAASISVAMPKSSSVGQKVVVDIIADTEGKTINSADVSLTYSQAVMEFVGYQSDAGFITLWIEQPHAENGTVKFIGGIPGGVDRTYGGSGSELTLVRLIFSANTPGNGEVAISGSTLLLNDGKGTALSHITTRASIVVTPATGAETDTPDSIPPLPFTVTFIPKNKSGDTPAMIVFGTTDRESGIKEYRVKSGFFSAWKVAKSPYRVGSSFISHIVKVKAIDVYGNTQQSKVRAPGFVSFGVVLTILLLISASILWRNVIKKRV